MHLILPAYDYKMMYRGLLTVRDDGTILTILIRKLDTIMLTPNIPINPLGTHAVILDMNVIRDLTSAVSHSNDEYPIIFVFNPNYGQLSPTSKTPIAYLGGAFILNNTNDQNTSNQTIHYLIGYSRAWVYENGRWRRSTICRGENGYESACKLYLTLVVDGELDNLGPGRRIRIEVHVDDKVLTADNVILYNARYRDVKVFERSFIELGEPYALQCVNSRISNGVEFSLCPVDAEVIHLGAQLVVKGEERRHYVYFVMPTVISYSAKLPKNTGDAALPKDYIFNTALLKFSITKFSWDDALHLIDWLWSRHRDAVFKLFLNMDVMRSLWRIFSDEAGNTRPPFIEHTVTTQFYNKYLINYSLNLRQFTELYYNISRNHVSIGDLVNQVFSINGIRVEVDREREEMVKKVLAIYALMYGLHGISHLLMKALGALTGLNDYGELVSITVDGGGLSEDVSEVLEMNLFSTSNKEVYHENIFYITVGSQFRLDVNVFSRKRYSFHYFKELLNDGSGSLNFNKIINVINNLLLIDGNDRCEFNWNMERRLLEFGRVKFLDDQLSRADSELGNWLNNHYKPTRSLFRILYAYRLVWDMVNASIGEGSRDARSQFMRRLNRYMSFIWPYHLEQCVDGCYNCVLVSRSIKSNTCDMTPLMQELKTSKWAALYLLKYANLFNASWMG